jgi:hypothetical protein
MKNALLGKMSKALFVAMYGSNKVQGRNSLLGEVLCGIEMPSNGQRGQFDDECSMPRVKSWLFDHEFTFLIGIPSSRRHLG